MNFKKIALALLVSIFSFSTYCQKEEYTHDGFFLSLSLGPNIGSGNFTEKNAYDLDLSGVGASFDILLGGSLKNNFAIHATLANASFVNPDHSNGFSKQDLFVRTEFLGVGVTFYSGKNFYFSPNIGKAAMRLMDKDKIQLQSVKGIGLVLRGGKEWWVGEQWGLGLSLAYRGASTITDLGNGIEGDWKSSNFSLSLSATFN